MNQSNNLRDTYTVYDVELVHCIWCWTSVSKVSPTLRFLYSVTPNGRVVFSNSLQHFLKSLLFVLAWENYRCSIHYSKHYWHLEPDIVYLGRIILTRHSAGYYRLAPAHWEGKIVSRECIWDTCQHFSDLFKHHRLSQLKFFDVEILPNNNAVG